MRLTDRDRAIARLVARWGPVTQPQVARGAQLTRLPSFRRLQALREAGYFHYERPLDGSPGVFTATSAGVELAGLVEDGHGTPPAYALWPHLAAVDVAIDAEGRGIQTATRLEALTDERLRSLIPRTRDGAAVAPRALVLDERPIAVYAVTRPVHAPAGVRDELVAVTIAAYSMLSASGLTIRVLMPDEMAADPAVDSLRQVGHEVVVVESALVGHAP